MAKQAGEWNEEMASVFIASTCLLISKTFLDYSDHMHNSMPSKCSGPAEYSVTCDSSAEFYIRPLNTCIDDVDLLIARADELVFSGNLTALPSDMSGLANKIKCYKIEPYDTYLGFLRLLIWGEMNYKWEYKKYEFNYTSDTYSYAGLIRGRDEDMFYPLTIQKLIKLHVNTINGPAVRRQR